MTSRPVPIRAARKRLFLASIARWGSVTRAAQETGIHKSSHYEWMQRDPVYAAAYKQAEDEAIEAMEAEARRRAVEGVSKPVFGKGGEVYGHITEYSDQLLMFLLKGKRPEVYRERVDLTVDIRKEAERIAAEAGLEADAVLAEAERIIAAGRSAE